MWVLGLMKAVFLMDVLEWCVFGGVVFLEDDDRGGDMW